MDTRKNKGFEISFDPARRILRVHAWGFWDAEFAKKYNSAFTEKVEGIRTDGKAWDVLMDLTEFHPYSTEVQDMLHQHLTTATKQGMRKVVCLGKMSVAQLHLRELFLVRDLPQYAFVESEEEAMQWLLYERPNP
jgi:hypothetical protein